MAKKSKRKSTKKNPPIKTPVVTSNDIRTIRKTLDESIILLKQGLDKLKEFNDELGKISNK